MARLATWMASPAVAGSTGPRRSASRPAYGTATDPST